MRSTTLLAAVLASSGAVWAQMLNKLAKDAGLLYFGTSFNPGEVNDAPYYKLASDPNMFGQWTPDNAQKWDATEPSKGRFSYGQADATIGRATQNGQIMRCHTLVWHSQLPGWVSSGSWNRSTLTDVINSHISNVMGHFKGKCYAWDVVNEALEDNGSYRNSVFYRVLGDSYFALAFKQAAATDPGAKLYYNDYNLEYFPAKADGAVRIAKLVQAAGARIDGVGLQAHMTVGRTPARANLTWTLGKYTALGLDVAYTELDVRIDPLPSTAGSLAAQGREYEAVVGSCLDVPRCVGITVWGFGDAHSWVPGTFRGTGDANLYDKQARPKPAYSSVSAVLAKASGKRPAWGSKPATTVARVPEAAAAVVTAAPM
ncbi:hypothetical protein RB593_009259 [Gaeumannomyces tritici]